MLVGSPSLFLSLSLSLSSGKRGSQAVADRASIFPVTDPIDSRGKVCVHASTSGNREKVIGKGQLVFDNRETRVPQVTLSRA